MVCVGWCRRSALPLKGLFESSAKGSGGYDDGRYKGRCTYIQKSFVSTGMKELIASPEWKAMVYWDELFHKAVNRSLDLTIQDLGVKEFQYQLSKFHKEKHLFEDKCLKQVRLPCSANGTRNSQTDCLLDDMGCGFKCMDSILSEQQTPSVKLKAS